MGTKGQPNEQSAVAAARLLDQEEYAYQLSLKDRALASSAEGITISDPSQPDNPLIYANAGFERLTGYSVKEVLGKNCRFLQGPDTDQRTVDKIRAAVREEKPITVELLNYRKDGRPFWNRLSITPVGDAQGRTTHFIGVQSDVTVRRNVEEALRDANKQLEAAGKRMKNDLEAAAKIQEALLPAELPESKDVHFAWTFKPCDELAGDILNIFQLDDHQIGMYILDVSGHGVSAALLSVTLSRWLAPIPGHSCVFKPVPQRPGDYEPTAPAEVADQLNQRFQLGTDNPQFFTFLYGILDIHARAFRYACAGHHPPIHCPAVGSPRIQQEGDVAIGVLRETEYQERTLRLKPGDRLYFFTDGVIEALDEHMEHFGSNRLAHLLQHNQHATIEQNIAQVISEVQSWCPDARLEDDATMVALEIVGS